MYSSMSPFEWYNLNMYRVKESWGKSSFSENNKNTFFGLYLLISPAKSPFSLGKKFGNIRHICEKKTYPRSLFFWGGGVVHGKACWLRAYSIYEINCQCLLTVYR